MRDILKIAKKFFLLIKEADYYHTVNDGILNKKRNKRNRCPQYCQVDLISQANDIMAKIHYLNTNNKKEIYNLYVSNKSLFAEVDTTFASVQRWNNLANQQRVANIQNNTPVNNPGPVPTHLIDSKDKKNKIKYKNDLKSVKELQDHQKKLDEYHESFGSRDYCFIISMQRNNNPNNDLLDLQTFRPKWENCVTGKSSLPLNNVRDFYNFYNNCVKINAQRAAAQAAAQAAENEREKEKELIPRSIIILRKNRNKFYLLKSETQPSKDDFVNIFDSEADAKKYTEEYFINNANEINAKKEEDSSYNIIFKIGKIVYDNVIQETSVEKVSEVSFEDWKKEAVGYSIQKNVTKSDFKDSEKLPEIFYSYQSCVDYILNFFNQNESKILEKTKIDKNYNIEFKIFKKIKNQDEEKIISIDFENWFIMDSLEREGLKIEKRAMSLIRRRKIMKRSSIFLKITMV